MILVAYAIICATTDELGRPFFWPIWTREWPLLPIAFL